MKEVTKSHELNIPTREEFHRYAGNLLTPDDFNTTYSNNSIGSDSIDAERYS